MREHVVADRIVYTVEDPWPIGLLTGRVNSAGGFELEHVAPFTPMAARTLVRKGLDYAWSRGWAYVLFYVPPRHPMKRALTNLGRRLGFTEYATGFWVKYR